MSDAAPPISDDLAVASRLLEAMEHPVALLDSHLRIRLASSALCHVCGVPPTHIIDADIVELLGIAGDREPLAALLGDILDGHQDVGELVSNADRTSSARARTWRIRAHRTVLTHEPVLVLTVWDMTNRASEEKRHHDILANVHDAIIETDLQFRIKQWNRGAEVLYGWSASEVVGRRMSEVVPTSFGQQTVLQNQQQLFAMGHTSSEAQQERRNGDPLLVDASCSLLRDSTGTPVGVVFINRDVTERKRVQTLLSQHERQQRAVAELGMFAVHENANAVMKRAVGAAAELLAVERCEVFELLPDRQALLLREGVGGPRELICNVTVAAEAPSPVSLALQSGQPCVVSDATVDPRWVGTAVAHDQDAVSGVSVVIPGRETVFGVLSIKCQTPREFSSDDVHFLQAVANIIADALTRAEITHQLRHANRLNTVGKLSVSLTHEFGTPLNVISAYANMILRGQLQGEEMLKGLTSISEQVGRATHLVRQLLDFSRQSAVGQRAHSVSQLVLRTVDMLQPLARQRRVVIDVALLEHERPTSMQEQTLQQVLSNLIINAIDAQSSGGRVDIDISLGRPPGDSSQSSEEYVCIAIADQGPGVPAHLRDQIFNAFFTTKQAGRGTGLGLSVSKQLMEEAGGTLVLSQDSSKGACFRVYIPTSIRP